MAEVPIGGDFFGNPYLAKQFAQLQKRYTERLLAGIKAWKEISYQVIDPEKALKYCPEEYDRIEDAAALSKRFVEFMDDGQWRKNTIFPVKTSEAISRRLEMAETPEKNWLIANRL